MRIILSIMRIILSPQGRDDAAPLVASKAGDILTVNGETYDFGPLPEGMALDTDAIPGDLITTARRLDGDLEITLTLPLSPWITPEAYMAFPEPLEDVPDGPVDLPHDPIITVEEVNGVRRTTVTRWHQEPEVTEEPLPEPEHASEEDA